MADNIIQRIIKLVLDRDSARKAQDDMTSVADAIEEKWKSAATRIAEYLGIAFLTDKIFEFAKASVEHASEADLSWRQLKGTIDATGASFDGMAEHLKAASEAFEDATTHRDEEYIQSLTRMITLTGDVSASTNNMGLVANVAAQFYKGDLEPAITLVAKAMNGNVMMLQRLGIHAKDAQDALNILSQRSMGAAERAAGSFDGQLKQLHNSLIGVMEDFGNAIIGSDGTKSALGFLRNAVQTLGEWINRNKGEIQTWVTTGIAFAIDSLDVLIRAFQSLVLVMYPVYFGIAAITEGMYFFVKAASAVNEILIANAILHGQDASGWIKNQIAIDKAAKSLEDFGNAAKQLEKETLERAGKALTTPLFSSDQFKTPPKPGKLDVETPEVSKNAFGKDAKEVEKAIEEFKKATLAAENMKKILGDAFDGVGAEIDRSTKLLNVLAGNGIPPAEKGFANLASRLHTLVTETKPLADIQKELAKTMQSDLAMSLVTMGTGLDNATTKTDRLKAQQADILGEIKKMTGTVLENSAAYKDLVEQYNIYANAIEDQSRVDAVVKANKDLNEAIGANMAKAALTGAGAVDQLKFQQDALGSALDTLRTAKVDPLSEAFLTLQQRWLDTTDALKQATVIQQTADILAQLGDTIKQDLEMSALNAGNELDRLRIKQQALGEAIKKMSADPLKRESEDLRRLKQDYKDVTEAITEQTAAMAYQATIADLLADILGTAMQGGLAAAAAQKAKQNAIEAAEMVVRAGVFALFGNIPAATAALYAAGQFAILAAAWGTLAAATGGGAGGGSSAPAVTPASAQGTGTDLTSSREASSQASSSSAQPSPEVSIYLVGPGFNAVNPKVQEVIWGAMQEATERYGAGTRIRIRTTEGQ